MPKIWKGTRMSTVDLTGFDDKGVVLHFFGEGHKVDAITLGRALASFSETAKSIARQTYPDTDIEITVDSESIRPGSLRIYLKIAIVSSAILFSDDPTEVIISSVAFQMLRRNTTNKEETHQKRDDSSLIVSREVERTVEMDGELKTEKDRENLIVPINAYNVLENIKDESKVDKNISDLAKAINDDKSIESFGISSDLEKSEPIIRLPKSDFPTIIQNTAPNANREERTIIEDVVIEIHKAVFERSKQKWGFIWNENKISGSILDHDFFDLLEERKIAIKHGDVFEATLRIYQIRDPKTGSWENKKYEIIKLGDRIRQQYDQDKLDF